MGQLFYFSRPILKNFYIFTIRLTIADAYVLVASTMIRFFLLFLFLLTTGSYASPLPANQAFSFTTRIVDPNNFVVNWQIHPGYFLYKDRIHIKTGDTDRIQLGGVRWPNADTKTDKMNRTYPIYRNSISVPVALLGKNPGEALISLAFQGCSDAGFCYPPQQAQLKVTIDANLALSQISPDLSTTTTLHHNTRVTPADSVFTKHHWPMILLSFLGFGLLLSFTPCVLPMIPVLSGIIVGHGHPISLRRSFFVSLSYVLSMATTYAFFGALVALIGSNLQISMQSPWAIGLFSAVFVLLALSMFGYFELALPASWQQKLNRTANHHAGGHYAGAAIMGALSTLILSPCVTAPLIGALGYIAQTGNAAFGSLCLFFLGLGMGIPLLIIGTSAGSLLPRAGAWMNDIKALFGIALLVVAISLISRIIPPFITMLLWSSLLVFVGLYCGAFTAAPNKARQGLGILLLVYGLLILVGASIGSTNPWMPLKQIATIRNNPPKTFHPILIRTVADAKAALKETDKPVMIDFYADWCVSCKIIATTVLADQEVDAALESFTVLKIDLTKNTEANQDLLRYFNVVAPPTFLFFDKTGERQEARMVGEIDKHDFLTTIKRLLN